MPRGLNVADKNFEAEMDAHVLIQAEKVKMDKKKFAAAKKMIPKMMKQQMKEKLAMEKAMKK